MKVCIFYSELYTKYALYSISFSIIFHMHLLYRIEMNFVNICGNCYVKVRNILQTLFAFLMLKKFITSCFLFLLIKT